RYARRRGRDGRGDQRRGLDQYPLTVRSPHQSVGNPFHDDSWPSLTTQRREGPVTFPAGVKFADKGRATGVEAPANNSGARVERSGPSATLRRGPSTDERAVNLHAVRPNACSIPS